MRVLLVSNLFPPDVLGGYELLAEDVTLALRQRGHDVTVWTTGAQRLGEPPWLQRGLSLVRPFAEAGSLDRLRHMRAAVVQRLATRRLLSDATPFDAALVMSLRRLGLHVPRALADYRVPQVYCFNDDWLLSCRPADASSAAKRAFLSAAERGIAGSRTWRGLRFDRAIYVSDALRKALLDAGAPLPEGLVCWQGVRQSVFYPRRKRRVPADPKLLYVGRIHPTKGCDLAIAALARLRALGSNATLTLVGTGSTAELARLEALVLRLGVRASVRWEGFVGRAKTPAIYRAHDVLLFPSLWDEPAGLTYLEAMSCGVPVVALARGGARELLEHEKNCLVASDEDDIAQAVRRLTAEPDLCARLIEGGTRLVSEKASLDLYIDAIEDQLAAAARTSGKHH